MVRRLICSAVIVACAGVYVFAAAERANFILTNGERQSGTVAFHGDQHENLINGHLNLATSDKDLTFPVEQVAVIDFTGGRPSANWHARLAAGALSCSRGGCYQKGRFFKKTAGCRAYGGNGDSRPDGWAV